jgi:hypothetical protein
MFKTKLFLALLMLNGAANAAVIASGSAAGSAGATTAGIPVTVTADTATALIQAEVKYDQTKITLAAANVTNGAGFTCTVNQATGVVAIIGGSDTAPLAATTTACTIAYPVNAAVVAADFPLSLVVRNQLCSTFDGNATGQPCTTTNGQITGTVVGANTWTAATPVNLGNAAAGGTAAGNVVLTATAGNTAAGSITACTLAGANAASFNTNATFPLALTQTGATNLPVRFQPPAAAPAGAQAATISCTGAAGTTLAGFPVTLNGTVTVGATPVYSSNPAPLAPVNIPTATGTANLVITNAGLVGAGALTVTASGLTGAISITPGTASIAQGASSTLAIACNNTTATAITQTLSIAHNGTAPPASPVTHSVTCAGVTPGSVISAGTAPGTLTLPSYTVGGAPTNRVLAFTGTAGGSLSCALSGTNATSFSVTPVPLVLVGTTAGNVTLAANAGLAAGTYNATLTCTSAAPATGGPFVYPFSLVVGGVQAAVVQAPSLNIFGSLLLIAGFLGLGLVLVNRRQG